MINEQVLTFEDFIDACKHFNINLGLFEQTTIEAEIKAYQLLGEFLQEHNLACYFRLDGSFEISKNIAKLINI